MSPDKAFAHWRLSLTLLIPLLRLWQCFGINGWARVFQEKLLLLQERLEDSFQEIAEKSGQKAVLLCDRGLMDGKGYMDLVEWDGMLEDLSLNEVDIRDNRYNSVFHLVTAAEGAESFYTKENNTARTESIPEARKLDADTQRSWLGHPHHFIFGNDTDFEGKLRSLISTVSSQVGIPSFEKSTVKFLLDEDRDWEIVCKENGVECQTFQIEKVYLYEGGDYVGGRVSPSSSPKGVQVVEGDYTSAAPPPPPRSLSPMSSTPIKGARQPPNVKAEYSFVRKREGRDSTAYGQTTVQTTSEGQVIEVKRIITGREYRNLVRNRDGRRHVVRQTRVSFIWDGMSFSAHRYLQPINGVSILHAQRGGEEVEVGVPAWIGGGRELDVQGKDRGLGAYEISKRKR